MATEKQIAANRANALHSTGPRTEAGLAASSRNNLRHGLTVRGFVVLAGQEDAFEELEAGLHAHLIPVGPLQEVIFKRILESSWNMERCRQAVIALQSIANLPDLDPLLDPHNLTRYANIQKYAREAENSLYKGMRELGKLQAEQQYRHEKFPLSETQRENVTEFDQTPHSLSDVCSFADVVNTVTSQIQVEAKTNSINMDTELKALDKLPPPEYVRRYEANSPQSAAATEPAPEIVRAAAA